MAGYVKGTKGWHQKMIGLMVNDIRKIHENHPELDEDLKKLTKDLGRYIEVVLPATDESEKSLSDVMIKKIFG